MFHVLCVCRCQSPHLPKSLLVYYMLCLQVRNLPPGVEADSVFDDETLEAVQEAMGAVGAVVLVRFVDNRIWFTFSDSQTALQAVSCTPLKVDT